MICSVKPVLTEDLYIVVYSAKGRIFSNILYVRKLTLEERPSIFLRDKPIFSSERYITTITARVQLKNFSGRGSQGA
jgi:hypothetical protein